MQELFDIVRGEGRISEFLRAPPPWLSPERGVVGLGVAYSRRLVSEVVREVRRTTDAPRSTVEFSAHVAAVLRRIARGIGGASVSGDIGRIDVERPLSRWKRQSYSAFGKYFEPIEIEVDLAADVSKQSVHEDWGRFGLEDVRLNLRSARRSSLQSAESGGRVTPRAVMEPNMARWGTIGGFVEANDGTRYAMTAAHVVDQGCAVDGTRAPGIFPLILSRIFGSVRRHDEGIVEFCSPPDLVPKYQCTARSVPLTQGLDIALARWPTEGATLRQVTSVVPVENLSQALPVWFIGARSGRVSVRIDQASIWHSYRLRQGTGGLALDEPRACVAHCLQIALPTRPYVQKDVSKNGDSGSWLMATSVSGSVWVGSLVGGDGERSGAVPADRIASYVTNEIGNFVPWI